MDVKRIADFLELQTLLDGMKRIRRQSLVPGREMEETDAEHSWHVALWYLTLMDLFENVDHFKIIVMLLIHDIPEIICGDAYVYCKNSDDVKNEKIAAIKIFNRFPSPLREKYLVIWQEFEEGVTKEAKIAKAIDALQPILQNINTNGKKWIEKGITLEILDKNKRPNVEVNEIVLMIYKELIKRAEKFIK